MTKPALQAIALTLFPEMFPGPLGHSLAGKALSNGLWSLKALQIRDFTTDRHKTVDDTPYGGGAGMVLRPDVLDAAIAGAKASLPNGRLIYFTPRGAPLTQALVRELSQSQLILLCGRYEGIDERLLTAHEPLEISLGDYVLSGGEIAAITLLDACVRLIPGVMGAADSAQEESFGIADDFAGLLEYPHYTKPPIWNGQNVPDILLSGHHASIRDWRLQQAQAATQARRSDLWDRYVRTGLAKQTKN